MRNKKIGLYLGGWVLAFRVLTTYFFLNFINFSFADTYLPVVSNYAKALEQKIWEDVDNDVVPSALLKKVAIQTPSRAYLAPYSDVFLQNERIVVCWHLCTDPQNLKTTQTKDGNFEVSHKNSSYIRQATVYYWINQLFDRLEILGYVPQKPLLVYVDRDVEDPETGLDFNNNAFFNDLDWTLSFLPAQGSLLLKWFAGMDLRASSYDPSVAMHEAMHSVFQALIGRILNPEVYGLHEAFADYFSLTTIDSAKMGLVMFSGKNIRSADKFITYKKEMEAHDLGNVVLSVLWKIRGFYQNKNLADKIALETIQEISKNPYATAGTVVSAYMDVLDRLGGIELNAEPKLRTGVFLAWMKSLLTPQNANVDLQLLKGPVNSKKFMSTSFTLRVPDWIVRKYGISAQESIGLTLIEKRQNQKNADLVWYYVGVESDVPEHLRDVNATKYFVSPLWILYSKQLKAILAGYDLSLNPVNKSSSVLYERLLKLGGAFEQFLDWSENFGEQARDLYTRKGLLHLIEETSKCQESNSFTSINGRLVPLKGHKVQIKGTVLAWTLGRLLGEELEYGLIKIKKYDSVTLYTVPSTSLNDQVLPQVLPGEKIIGYELKYKTGIKIKVLVQGIGEEQ